MQKTPPFAAVNEGREWSRLFARRRQALVLRDAVISCTCGREKDCAKIVPLLLLAGIFGGQQPLPDLHAWPSPGLHPPAAGAAGLDHPARATAGPPCNFSSRWSAPVSGTLHMSSTSEEPAAAPWLDLAIHPQLYSLLIVMVNLILFSDNNN